MTKQSESYEVTTHAGKSIWTKGTTRAKSSYALVSGLGDSLTVRICNEETAENGFVANKSVALRLNRAAAIALANQLIDEVTRQEKCDCEARREA